MTCAVFLFVIFIAIIEGKHFDNNICNNGKLPCFLSNIYFNIPDMQKKVLFATLHMTNIVCGNINLNNIQSSYVPPVTLSVKNIGFGITCSLDYSWAIFKGNATASASKNDSSISGDVMFIKNSKTNLTNSAKLLNGNVKIDITNINFSEKFLNSTVVKSAVLYLLNAELPSVMQEAITQGINYYLTDALLGINRVITPYLEGFPPKILLPRYNQSNLMNLTNNPVIALLDYTFNTIVGTDGPMSLNSIANHYSNGTGNISFSKLQNWNISFQTRNPFADVSIGINDMSFGGMNTFSVVELFIPHDSLFLSNNLKLSNFKADISFFVDTHLLKSLNYHLNYHYKHYKYGNETKEENEGESQGENEESSLSSSTSSSTSSSLLSLSSSSLSLYEKGVLHISMNDLSLDMDIFLGIDTKFAHKMSFQQILQEQCLKDAVQYTNVTQFAADFNLQEMNIFAFDGNKSDTNKLENQIDKFLDNALLLFVTSYAPAVPAFINGFVAGPITLKINKLISKFKTKDTHCPISSTEQNYWQLNIVAAILSFIFALVVWVFICVCAYVIKRRLTNNNGSTKNNGSPARTSLILTEHIPLYIRFGIPLILLCNIALFISSNTSIGASVYLVVDFAGHKLKSDSLFNFTLMSSIRDMWNARVFSLALLIAIFSGAWPYIKLLAMLFCWMSPSVLVSVRGREKILMILDALGKWSLIDTFILVFMMVVFSFNVTIPPAAYHSFINNNTSSSTTITTFVVPQMGFHSFVLATIVSLVMTHVILVFHRTVAMKDLKSTSQYQIVDLDWSDETDYRENNEFNDYNDDVLFSINNNNNNDISLLNDSEIVIDNELILFEQGRTALSSHSFHIHDVRVCFTFLGIVIVIGLLLASIGFLLAGGLVNSFAFEFSGAAATLLTYIGIENHKPFSLISLAMALPSSSESPTSFAIRWIQGSFMLFAFIIPLIYIVSILCLWIVPLYAKEQKAFFIVAEIIRAWSAMEVFVLAVVTALIALQQFTKFIIGDRCDTIDSLIKTFFPWIFEGGNEVCFNIKATLLRGCWLMFTAVVIYIIVGQIVMTLCHKVIQERDESFKKYEERTKTKCNWNCNWKCTKEYYRIAVECLVFLCEKCHILKKL